MKESQQAMTTCPYCGSDTRQVKAGMHGGNQRHKCMHCLHRYTPEPRQRGYPDTVRQEAITLSTQGMKAHQIARHLGLNPQTVNNWLTSMEKIERPVEESQTARPAQKRVDEPADPSLPLKWKPTINQVAERAGVSVATVSNCLNGKGRMSASTRARVQKAVEDLHFTPSGLMRAIRHRRTHILGVMMFDLSSLHRQVGTAVAPQLLAGINAAACEAAHNILLYTGLQPRTEYPAGSEFLDGHIDGLLWVAAEVPESPLDRVAAAGLPTVALLTRLVPEGIGYVDADNISATRKLVAHLVAQGHRRIAYAGSIHSSNFLDRWEGYYQGLEAAGLAQDRDLEEKSEGMHRDPAVCANALERWLKLRQPPTAIMLQNDRWAATMIEAIRARGLRVPADIAVTGFDDCPDAQWIGGGLTTIRQPFMPMAQLAVRHLVSLLDGAPVEDCRTIIPTELVIRASTVGGTPDTKDVR